MKKMMFCGLLGLLLMLPAGCVYDDYDYGYPSSPPPGYGGGYYHRGYPPPPPPKPDHHHHAKTKNPACSIPADWI